VRIFLIVGIIFNAIQCLQSLYLAAQDGDGVLLSSASASFRSLFNDFTEDNDNNGGDFDAAADIDDGQSPRLYHNATKVKATDPIHVPPCALCFFGLPRSYKTMVLPSIKQNVLMPNRDYQCDVYVHFYIQHEEASGRSGSGGAIDPTEILELRHAVQKIFEEDVTIGKSPRIVVSYVNNTDEEFWQMRGDAIKKYETTKDENGKYLYYPWKARTYHYPTTLHNIVKQWHSIEAVWNHMEATSKRLGKTYERVAMLRNDVMYMTPVDIYELEHEKYDFDNRHAIIPDFARFPVNDRMIYGPREAVKMWATQRFPLIDNHVVTYPEPGFGMHSERFLNHTILTPIQNDFGIEVRTNPDICFFPVRADQSTWISDCTTTGGATRGFRGKPLMKYVERILGRPCVKSKLRQRVVQAHCPLQ